jgi:hypothetical protein
MVARYQLRTKLNFRVEYAPSLPFSSQVDIADQPKNSDHDQIYRNDIVQ